MKRGSQIAVNGTIRQSTESASNRQRQRRGSCEMANPAHEATTIVIGTASAMTNSEFAA